MTLEGHGSAPIYKKDYSSRWLGKVFDVTLPLADVAESYRAMDERRAIKTLLRL